MATKTSPITPKMAAFAREYLTTGEVFTSYQKAGYTVTNKVTAATEASKLLKNPKVMAELDRLRSLQDKQFVLNSDFVINKLVHLVQTTEKDGDRIRALELLGKTMALFKERQEVSGPDGEAIRYEQKKAQDVDDFTKRLQRLSRPAASGSGSKPKPSDEAGEDADSGAGNVSPIAKRG